MENEAFIWPPFSLIGRRPLRLVYRQKYIGALFVSVALPGRFLLLSNFWFDCLWYDSKLSYQTLLMTTGNYDVFVYHWWQDNAIYLSRESCWIQSKRLDVDLIHFRAGWRRKCPETWVETKRIYHLHWKRIWKNTVHQGKMGLRTSADIRSYHPALPYLHLSSSQLMEMYRRHGRLILWIGSHCTANQSSSFSPSPSIVWDILKNVPTTWEIHFCFSTTVSHSVQFRI